MTPNFARAHAPTITCPHRTHQRNRIPATLTRRSDSYRPIAQVAVAKRRRQRTYPINHSTVSRRYSGSRSSLTAVLVDARSRANARRMRRKNLWLRHYAVTLRCEVERCVFCRFCRLFQLLSHHMKEEVVEGDIQITISIIIISHTAKRDAAR